MIPNFQLRRAQQSDIDDFISKEMMTTPTEQRVIQNKKPTAFMKPSLGINPFKKQKSPEPKPFPRHEEENEKSPPTFARD